MQLSIEQLFKESADKNGVEFRNHMTLITGEFQRMTQNNSNLALYLDPLARLIKEDNPQQLVTPVDKLLAQYTLSAYRAFTDGGESKSFKDALNTVTSRLQEVKNNFKLGQPLANSIRDFNNACGYAKQLKPLTKGQRATNIALLCVFAAVALSCMILAPAVPYIGVYVLTSLAGIASLAFSIYLGIKVFRNNPSIFNAKPKECKDAIKAVNKMKSMTPGRVGYQRV